jgi:predicted deacylase
VPLCLLPLAAVCALGLLVAPVALAGVKVGKHRHTPEQPSSRTETQSSKSKDAVEAATPEIAVEEARGDTVREGLPISLLGEEVRPGSFRRLDWKPLPSFDGIAAPTPVLVSHGANAGPVLCLTAAVHGDELNGIEIVRRVLYGLDPEKLSGTVIGVPIVNLQGFRRSSRYLPDRRDLNRFFPGNPAGSSASRIAHSFFEDVVRHCSVLVDMHTGSFHRTNLPQLRADLTNDDVVELVQGFAGTIVLHNEGGAGTLRRAAVEAGIPSVTLETGEPLRLQAGEIEHGVAGVHALLSRMSMLEGQDAGGEFGEPVYYRSTWIRADQGGILLSEVDLGERVLKGEVLGTVTDPITNAESRLRSPADGRVLGMALNQVVLPGFAAYRIGVETARDRMGEPGHGNPDDPEEGGDINAE